MRLMLSIAFFLANASISFYAIAKTEENNPDSNAYLGARFGYSHNQASCTSNYIECDKNDTAYGLFAGYEFSPMWAVELSYNDVGDTEAVYPSVSLTGKINEIDLALRRSYALYHNLDIYGKLGAAYWDARVEGPTTISDSGFSPLVGGGLELTISDRWKGRLEYQYIDQIGNQQMGRANPHFIGLALIWNFPLQQQKVAAPLVVQVVKEPAPVEKTPVETPPAVPTIEQRIVIDEQLAGALFEFNKSEIRNTAVIDPVVNLLLKNPSLNVNIVGHTDSKGTTEYNQRLSETRAHVVAKYLHSKGIPLNKIKVFGMGEDQPVTSNDSEEGRAKNRRVEFILINTDQLH